MNVKTFPAILIGSEYNKLNVERSKNYSAVIMLIIMNKSHSQPAVRH